MSDEIIDVRAVGPEDWPLLRTVRLRALADAPEAFSTTLAQAQARTEDEWRAAALRYNSPGESAYLAYRGEQVCGMIAAFVAEGCLSESPSAELQAAWVDPSQRGAGVAEALVGAAVEWARGHRAGTLRAWVMEANGRAVGFYRKVGFVETGEKKAFGDDLPRMALLMERSLAL